MKIALITPSISNPARLFGAEKHFLGLYEALRQVADTDWLPVPIGEATWEDVLQSYVDCYDLDVSRYDFVISTKNPTFMVQHPNHVCWLLHQIRVFYDRFQEEYGDLDPKSLQEHKQRRELIHTLDNYGFASLRKIFTNGCETARRLKQYSGFDAEVLYPPVLNSGYHCGGQDYLLLPGRLHRWKRVDLAIRALKLVPDDIPLLIAGTGEHDALFRAAAAGDPRVQFLGYVSDDELMELYAHSLAVLFVPKNEDFGYITIEAMLSHKPVITCSDSGEPSRLIQNGTTGLVVGPDPAEIADAVRQLVRDRGRARAMGEAAFRSAPPQSWEAVAQRLLAEGRSGAPQQSVSVALPPSTLPAQAARAGCATAFGPKRPKIFFSDNQVLDPPVGGGRIRIYELCRELALHNFDVTYVGAYDWPGPTFRDQYLSPCFREIVTPLTQPHFALNRWIQRLAGGKTVIDVTIPYLLRFSPRFRDLAAEHARDAAFVVVSHPWVYPYIPHLPEQVLVYDAHNCEAEVKAQILGRGVVGRWLVRGVRKVETKLCRDADLIFACSAEDIDRLAGSYGIPREKFVVVENGVNVDEVVPADPDQKRRAKEALEIAVDTPLLIFIGSGYLPNAEAATFITEHLAPRLPESSFMIVGSIRDFCLQNRLALAEDPLPNVHWTGTVDNARKLLIYQAADIALNPMFSGSGTNLKMLDYFAAGLPVVSTPAGARGLEVTDTDCVICDAAVFEPRIRFLLRDVEVRTDFGTAARRLVARCYSWKAIVERAGKALESTASDKRKFFGVSHA